MAASFVRERVALNRFGARRAILSAECQADPARGVDDFART